MILDSKKIDYDKVDIAQLGNEDAKEKMREVMGDPCGVPPQLTKGDTYLGVSFILTYKSVTFLSVLQISCFCNIGAQASPEKQSMLIFYV